MAPWVPMIPKKIVLQVKAEIRKIILDLGTPTYIKKADIEPELRKRKKAIEGHEQYFSRVIHEGIMEARLGPYKYVPYSNVKNGSRSRTYMRVET
jgi:hypothetical protein